MTLEDSARTTLERLSALDEALGSAEDAVEAAARQADETGHAVEAEWSAVTRTAEAVLDQIASEAEAGRDAAAELDEALAAAADALRETDDQAGDALEEIEQGFDAMGERARDLRAAAEERLEELRERAERLEDRAQRVQGQVADLLDEATALFEEELRPELADLRAGVQDRCEELDAFIHDECLTPLGEECDAFSDQVQQYQAELEQAVEGMIERNTEAVRDALAACREDFQAEIADLLQACDAAGRALAEAAESLGEGTREVAGMAAAVTTLHDEHTRGFEGLRETLDHVRETFGRFSFLK